MEKSASNSVEKKVSPPVVQSEALFQGYKEVIIVHQNQRYRLLMTKAGKLILNK